MKAGKMKKTNLILTGIFLFISFVSAHAGDDYYNHHGMMGGYYAYGIFGGVMMWIFMILIIVGLVLLIVYLVREIQKGNKTTRRSKK